MQRRTVGTEHSRHVQSRHSRPVGNTRHPGDVLTVGRDQGRHCFARFSRDVRDTGDELVERKYERAHRRTTDQILIETVTDYRRSYRLLDTVIDQPFCSWTGSCCKRTCKSSAGNVLRMHEFSLGASTSLYREHGRAQAKKYEKRRCRSYLVKHSSTSLQMMMSEGLLRDAM